MPRPEQRAAEWGRFDRLRAAELAIEPTLGSPRAWDLLFAILLFAFWVDVARQNKGARRLATDPMPAHLSPENDQQLDLAIGRTKWRLYGTIRTFLFAMAFAYMGVIYLLSFVARLTALAGLDAIQLAAGVKLMVLRCQRWRGAHGHAARGEDRRRRVGVAAGATAVDVVQTTRPPHG